MPDPHAAIIERLFAFPRRDFIAVEHLHPPDLIQLHELSEAFATHDARGLDLLEGRTVALLSDDDDLSSYPHTVRHLSGEVAVVNYKGDDASLFNTRLTLKALKPDLIVFSHRASGAAEWFAGLSPCPVINAGDGTHQNPVQAFGDLLCLTRAFGQVDGLNIALIGDITHSAVGRSDVTLLSHMGANIRLIGPATLIPGDADQWGCALYHDLDEGLSGVDAIIVLPLSQDRIAEGLVPSRREYFHFFGLEYHKLTTAKPGLKIAHPGPVSLGVEIAADLATDAQISLIASGAETAFAAQLATLAAMSQRLEVQA